MISHRYKFVYCRTAKTGTCSIAGMLQNRKFLMNNYRHPDLKKIMKKWENSFDADPNHIPMSFLIENSNAESYSKFSFVRNPWDRLVSIHHWEKRFNKRNKMGNEIHDSFKAFVKNIENLKTGKLEDKNKKINSWFKYGSAYNFTKGSDFIGRFEQLQQDFYVVCNAIGIPPIELPHKNQTNHKHYTEYYDDETRDIVAEKYAKDIEYFGYEFGE